MLELVEGLDRKIELYPVLKELCERVDRKHVAVGGICDFEDYFLPVLMNKQVLFIVTDESGNVQTAAFCERATYDKASIFRINLLAGVMTDEWPGMLERIENWAKEYLNIKGFEFWGRPGFSKILIPAGYHLGMQHFIKDI